MRRISAWFFTIFLMFVGIGVAPARAVACQSGEIDVTGDGSNCQTAHFTIGTTSDTTALKFTMSPKGTFYVDCGNGGTLTQLGTTTGSTTSGKTITRENNSSKIYTCTWDTAGTQSVRFGGSATQTTTTYSTSTSTAAISFYLSSGGTQAKVASVTGNMSAVFPYITANAAGGAQPRFYQTFYGATNLTTVPDDLFSNYTTGASSMFYYTFSDCTGLTSIPAGLFSNITTGAERMFSSTFNGCTGLTSIPAGLFSNITTGASYMFFSTFQRCTGLTSIPADLFSGITTGASSMFGSTFNGCTGLTSIPGDLFSGITTGAERMFNSTFYVCTNLSGYIPPTTFKKGMGNYDSMWNYAFDGTKLVTSCPCGTKQYITGYEGLWSSKVSCEPDLDVDWATCKTCGNGTTQFVTPGVGVTCAVPVVSEITLSATGADTAAIPSTVYLKYNTGWYSDSSATNAITGLTTLPTKSGKVFAGFYTGENGTGTRVIDENGNLLTTNAALKFADTATTVYAHFANGYNITYEMNSGTNYSGAPTVYIEGTGATIDGIPTKAGYTFTGWCTDSELQNCAMSQTIGTDATGDKTFYAKWSECTACAATNASCSLSVVNNTCTYTTSCNTGYGNIQNNGAYNASCSPNSYAITYTMNGGTNYSGVPESYTYGTGTTINGMPTKSGYTFTGWTGDNGNTPQMTVTIGTDATGAKSYTANWSECTACAATNASCSLSVVNNVCTYTTTCNTNYGNMTNSGEHNASCSPNSYAITYTMNGGTNYDNAPATYIYTTGATLNGVPTKANNVFIGWTGDNGDTPQMSVTIGTDATGAKAYTANWSECQACSATNATCSFDGVVNNVCTYTTACNTGYGNMTNSGAYNATCTANTYTCAAGKYLRVLDATCADCTAGNFCVGITNATYTGSDLGLGTCPNEYPNSATGASAQNQCYKACTTSNVEHSATVTGNDYYGDGVDTCEALTCATGYHVEDVPDLNSIIGATTTMNYNHDNNVMSFYVNYGTGKGTVSGKAQCSTRNVANPWQNNNSTLSSDHFTTNLSDNTGQYCYCQLNGYRPDGGSAQSLSAPWIYLYDAGDASGCALHCAEICGRNLGLNDQSSWDRLAWRAAAFNSVADFCNANNYTITYTMNGGTNYAGAPESYTYGTGATIDGVPTKTGNTFAGWCTDAELQNCAMSQTISASDTGSKAFYAKWNMGAYNITYELNGGTNYAGAPESYTYGTGATIDGVPTKTGYTFTGWTGSNGNTPQMTVTIGTDATDAKSYTANWSECPACAATNAICSFNGIVDNVCTYTTSCDDGYYIQNNGTYNASCSECGGNYYYCTGGTRNHVTAGYYSTGGTETTRTGQSQCASGYYCSSGVQNECPTGYGNSVAGATAQAQCYKPCTTADVEHSATVIGNNYYGTNGNMCEAETCVAGSHAKPGTNPNLERIIGDSVGTVESLSGSYAGTFTISYGEKGTITGSSSCSSANSQSICNCTLNSYTPQNGSQQTLGAPSMMFTSYRGSNYEYECFNNCLSICANRIAQNTTQRTQLFRSITDRLTTCEIETYNITYTMNGGTNYDNAPATYVYTTGATLNGVPTKAGYTFIGWTGSNGNTPQMTVTIGTGETGAKSYIANWSECTACAATNATCSLSVVNNVCTYTTACESGYEDIQNNGAYNASCSEPQPTECTGTNFYDSALNACTPCPYGYNYNTTSGKTSVTQCQAQCAAGTFVESPGIYGYTRLEYLESSGGAVY